MTTLRQQMAAKRLMRRLRNVVAPAIVGAGLGGGILFTADWISARANTTAFYRDCDAARAAGAAPISMRQPGYRPELDADRDGVACEPYPR
ncbi:MAG: excalibur calcium-binding domain-containing protein [Proteobacteria bacterium]|nr:excalibur calcium-binding domain-containing protein [Pseudomonadota bacterium]